MTQPMMDTYRLQNSFSARASAQRPWLLLSRTHMPLPHFHRRHDHTADSHARHVRPSRVAPSSAAAVEVSPPTVQADSHSTPAEAESLNLLEWPAFCQQVACFTQTAIGAEMALTCQVPVGQTQAESERLLQETEEAQEAELKLKGVFDIRRALEAARAGLTLHPLVLGAVGLTLEAAQQVDDTLQQSPSSHPALFELASGLRGGVPVLQEALFKCIQVDDGRILDAASERLASTRTERRQNMQELRRTLDEWARLLHSKGVSERPQVVIRRDRLCVPVKAGRQGELPKGSITLAMSASGSTLYMEPEPVVALNNREMVLAGDEQEEETRVLMALSHMVASHADSIQRIMLAITSLDLATARARHATWLNATRPAFISPVEAQAVGLVRIPCAWHPLLLQSCLPPLPAHPAVDIRPASSGSDDDSPSAPGPPSSGGLSLVPELSADSGFGEPGPSSGRSPERRSAACEGPGANGSGSGGGAVCPPVPTELRVPPGVRVVAVTGPNTGGKTASLKALGLLTLMSKAGCFIPQAPLRTEGGGKPQHEGGTPQLVWFDKVLADLGDGQSLQQNLSTFSGHVRRIRNILAEVTPSSLVLLDEVGSGTDPTEGAALAAALLERLHCSAALTYATTHHAELKELASTTPGFVNASVEFDVATLRPTYRLQWGLAGESNALAVAAGLGFSVTIVARARQVAAKLHAAQDISQRSELLQRSLEEQLGEGEEQAKVAAAARHAAEAELAAARQQLQALQQEANTLSKKGNEGRELEDAKAELSKVLTAARSGALAVSDAEETVRKMEQAAAAAKQASMALVGLRVAKEAGLDWDGGSEDSSASQAARKNWTPRQGEAVRVMNLGATPGTVVAGPQGQGGGHKVSVRVGALTMEVRLADLAPLNGGTAAGGGAAKRGTAAGARQGPDREVSTSRAEAARAKEKLRAEGVLVADGEQGGSGPLGVAVAIQTRRNTVDVRGRQGDDAVSEVERALTLAAPGSVLFVVHGVGTGRVRAAVREALKRSRLVQRFEEQEESLGGCTIIYTLP